MDWIGTCKNQFGSTVEITNDADGKIEAFSARPCKTAASLESACRFLAFIWAIASAFPLRIPRGSAICFAPSAAYSAMEKSKRCGMSLRMDKA
jgi:hypothetical protein